MDTCTHWTVRLLKSPRWISRARKATEELGDGNVIREYYYDMFSDQLLRMVTRTLNASGDYAESVEKFVYDAIGNPTTYRGRTLTWGQGGRLTSYLGAVFTYDARGRRLSKNNTSFTYDSQGRLVKQSNGLTFFYDHTGVAGCIYNEQYYTYRKDAQGNIITLWQPSVIYDTVNSLRFSSRALSFPVLNKADE